MSSMNPLLSLSTPSQLIPSVRPRVVMGGGGGSLGFAGTCSTRQPPPEQKEPAGQLKPLQFWSYWRPPRHSPVAEQSVPVQQRSTQTELTQRWVALQVIPTQLCS